jgi:signal transduction histidine kinase
MAEILRVWVVEDDEAFREAVATSLKGLTVKLNHQGAEFRFDVEKALSGREYLDQEKSGQCPDFLFLDAGVPEKPILEFLHQMERSCPKCYTLVMTAEESVASSLARSPGYRFDYLRKPFSGDELRYAATKACERSLCVCQSKPVIADERWLMMHTILSMVAHELKAPLAAIEGYLQIIQDKTAGDNPELYEQMQERCLVRARGMRKLINNLLDLGSIQSGQRKRELVETDLVALARNAMATVDPDAKNNKIALNLRGPETLNYLADRGEMEIIFNNLLSNAVKYNVPGGKVDVTLEEAEDSVVISVSDSGIGIPEQDCEKLFQKFVRVKNEKTRGIEGTGLGLCIVKKIVELYHGAIEVKSVVDDGTTFFIRLPRD